MNNPDVQKPDTSAPTASTKSLDVAKSPANGKVESIDILADRLKARLQNQPNDLQGWVLLAKSYHFLGQWPEARWALEEAKARGYNGEFPLIPDKAQGPTALRIQSGGDNWLTDYLNQHVVNPGNDGDHADNGEAGFTIDISADAQLSNILPTTSAVYVFAREENKTGPPLAVRKISLSELPTTIHLTDDDAIIAEHNLSTAKRIIAGARISTTGDATRQPGDYEVLSGQPDDVPSRLALNFTVDALIEESAE